MKNLLVVGGAGRNVGKTEFVCRLIEHISQKVDVYALKVSTIFPDEQIYHGDHAADLSDNALVEETRRNIDKDTSRMLRAGGRKVFYLRSDDAAIATGFTAFLQRIPERSLIICESNSLAFIVKPAVHIVITSRHSPIKSRAALLIERADLVIESDGQSGFPEIERIGVREGMSWALKS
jgi:hypothetical protein